MNRKLISNRIIEEQLIQDDYYAFIDYEDLDESNYLINTALIMSNKR